MREPRITIVRDDGLGELNPRFLIDGRRWRLERDGLENFDRVEYSVSTQEYAQYDGAYLMSERSPAIDRTICAACVGEDIAAMREEAESFFIPARSYEVHVEAEGRRRWFAGRQYAFALTVDNLRNAQRLAWTVLALDPMLLSEDEKRFDLAEAAGHRGFPFPLLHRLRGALARGGSGRRARGRGAHARIRGGRALARDPDGDRGDAPAYPRFEISASGEVEDPSVLIRDARGTVVAQFGVSLTMEAGDLLVVDFSARPYRRRAQRGERAQPRDGGVDARDRHRGRQLHGRLVGRPRRRVPAHRAIDQGEVHDDMTPPVLSILGVDPAGAISMVATNVPTPPSSEPVALGAGDLLGAACLPRARRVARALPRGGRRARGGRDDREDRGLRRREDAAVYVRALRRVHVGALPRLGAGGERASGSGWRQAATAAMSAWHMGDVPPLELGAGTEEPSGSSYAVSGDAGESAADLIYSVLNANAAHPLVTYDRAGSPDRLIVRIVDELDRTTGQSERPPKIFSLAIGSALSVGYSGDYSTACSEIVAHLEKTVDQQDYDITETVGVPGFDPATGWRQRAYEDVSSLVADDAAPTPEAVREAAGLRALDHDAAVEVDSQVTPAGYLDEWDLGDLCEAEVAALALTAQERVEEVRLTVKPGGVSVEPVLGTKYLTRISRAMISRR